MVTGQAPVTHIGIGRWSPYIGIVDTRAPLRGWRASRLLRSHKEELDKIAKGVARTYRFGAISYLIMPRATCEELLALCHAVCLLAMSRSDRQYRCTLQRKKHEEDRQRTINQELKKTSTHVQAGTGYLVLRMTPGTVLCTKEKARRSTAQDGAAQHSTAGQVNALRC